MRTFSLLIVSMIFSTVVGCSEKSNESSTKKPLVLVSFAPLYSFASAVGGPDVEVKCLLTVNGPHNAGDPSSRDLELASEAKLLFINSLTLDTPYARKLEKAAGNTGLKIVHLGRLMKEGDKRLILEGECNHQHGDEHSHDDPHIWLGREQSVRMVELIRDELKTLLPEKAAEFDSRAAEYSRRLYQLNSESRTALKDKQQRSFITFHDSFQYFAASHDLKIAEVVEENPGVEPPPERLAALVDKCAKENITIITIEPQFPRKAAEAIVRELTLKGKEAFIVELDPLETCKPEELSVDWYEDRMRKNAQALAAVLK